MSKRSLLILSAVTLVVIVAAVITSQNRAPLTEIEKTHLLPELKNHINEVTAIRIASANQTIDFSRQDNYWVVNQADNYPADFSRIKQLALGISELIIISEKTSSPENFAELGVVEPDSADSDSRLLEFMDKSGNIISSIILGNSTQGGMPGRYVRKTSSNQTWLVNMTPELPTDVTEWIEKNLLDISTDRIMETTIEHPDGATVTLSRDEGEENFTVSDVPDGKEGRSFYFTNQPPTFLSSLSIENVMSDDEYMFIAPPIRTTIKTYDGLIATIASAQTNNTNRVTIHFSVDEEIINSTESEEPDQTIIIGEQATKPDVREEAMELNHKVAGWVYTVSNAKYQLLRKRPDELMDEM